MSAEQDKVVIILDGKKFDWRESALQRAVDLWKQGLSGKQIANYFRVSMDEAFLMLMHLGDVGMIDTRPGGWLGK